MVNKSFEGIKGGTEWLEKRLSTVQIIHGYGKIELGREEIINLKKFLEEALEEEF